ncbi:hypothetical protein [Streptomyces albireticuli]|uniref:Uncharacterized protein n=1 Tax=Streptomyces albireticuli TaxID=1940 RepID=A0A2A2DDS6_9ACTN|nr:hypothetical protein [Streptomyces albireticuli]MCD9141468.1 hypothetical protein [Streptomyces albireticuli]MCD9164281.1 hypothetical protein [Streptomyces albireticuli]MCD9196400.1 hypothetical protein [Streptomyces albireticuli]PAU49490.1 hypothetical protein CK936_07535 [Streptomyces albireticuli]
MTTIEEPAAWWVRRDGETDEDYARFKKFLDMGPARNLVDYAQQQGISYGHARRLAAHGRWTERARDFDQQQAYMIRLRARHAHREGMLVTDLALVETARNLAPVAGRVHELPVQRQLDGLVAVSKAITDRARTYYGQDTDVAPSLAAPTLADAIGSGVWAELCEVLDEVLDDQARQKLARLLEERHRTSLPPAEQS